MQWLALLKEWTDRKKYRDETEKSEELSDLEEFIDEPYALDKVTHRFSLTSWVRKKTH